MLLWLPAIVLGSVLLAEGAIRMLYAYAISRGEVQPLLYERVYWASPPWVHQQTIMYQDEELGLWMRPHVRRAYLNLFGPIGDLRDVGVMMSGLTPSLPAWASRRPVWHLATNSYGVRDDEFDAAKPPSTFRIAVMGDSWVVGVNVERESTFPDQLERMLASTYPQGRFEVLNFGTIGAAAETGRRLLARVLAISPDVVILAYAQNDEAAVRRAAETSPEPPDPDENGHASTWLAAHVGSLELYRLYAYLRSPVSRSADATIRRELTRVGGVPQNTRALSCPNARVQESGYRKIIEGLVTTTRRSGVEPLLLYDNVPEFPSHCTLAVLQEVSRRARVPLVEAPALLAAVGESLESRTERMLGLEAHPDLLGDEREEIAAVFRVDMSSVDEPSHASIMGNDPALGGFVPNQVRLFDDATHGDQVAEDGVWSRVFRFPAPTVVSYSFTNGDRTGEWTGLESYHPRVFALRRDDVGHTVYLPVARFGYQTLRSDPSHPDEEGYAVIAHALLQALRGSPALQRYLAATNPATMEARSTAPGAVTADVDANPRAEAR